jgi:hypothetical protein
MVLGRPHKKPLQVSQQKLIREASRSESEEKHAKTHTRPQKERTLLEIAIYA